MRERVTRKCATPAGQAFLEEIGEARARWALAIGMSLPDAKDYAMAGVRALARGMARDFIVEVDGQACVEEMPIVKPTTTNHQQGRLL